MNDLSSFRLYLLRAAYLLVVVGLGVQIWPAILNHSGNWELMPGVVKCMLGAFSVLAVLGIRYPLKMLPLLFWEVVWKSTWLVAVALPLWSADKMDAATAETAFACLFVIIFLIVIPWPYVVKNYVTKAGDPWGRRTPARE